METNAFSIIKGRYLVIIWLLPFICMPGIELLIYKLIDSTSELYWYEIIYYYYYHAFVAISLLILIYFGKPNCRVMFGEFQKKELFPSLKLTAFTFVFSIATAYLLFYPLSYILPEFVQYWYIDIPPIILSSNNTYSILPNLLKFISIVAIAPILEEFIFRGLLLHRWHKKWGLNYAIILSSLLFGIAHPDPIGATAFGMAMCVLYLRTQSLWVPIICHATYNFVVWLMEAVWIYYYGAGDIYTLQKFQEEWYLGLFTMVITVFWIYYYISKPKSYRTWCLPNA